MRHRPVVAATFAIATLLAPATGFAQEAPAAPSVAQETTDAAVVAYQSGRYDEALNAFRQRVRVAQAPVDDHRYLGRVLLEVGRYEEAEQAARNFIAAHPDSSQLHNTLGEALWATGRMDEAEEAFRTAMMGGADDYMTAELNLAIAAFDRGRRDEAMRRFDRFIDAYNDGEAETSEELAAVGIACRYLGINDKDLFHDSLRALDEAADADPNSVRPRILTGSLFLDKYDSSQAVGDLTAALEINPSHPEGLLAMARLLQFDNAPGATETAGRALEVNPNLVAAHVFRAHQLLTLERYDDALDWVDRALGVNPASLDALAMLATARYLQGDMPAFERARDRALAINPGYADLYNTLADLAVQNRLYAQAVDFARQATTIDPQSWRGYSILGVNQTRIGDIEGGRRSLEISFAGDPFNIWVKNTLDLLDTFPDYVESSTERFDLMVEGPEAVLLSLYLGELAEAAYDYFAERYQYAPPTPIRIEVYPSHPDFSVRTVGIAGLGALGVSFGPVIAIDSPSARELGEFNWGTTLWHEIGHTFTLGATDFKIPRWFSEGLSVYEERRGLTAWGDDASVSFLMAHLQDELLPMDRITDGFVRPSYPEQIIHAYFQASMVCELIDRDWGFDAILGLLDAYKYGSTTEEAFAAVLGVDLETFDERFTAYIDETFATPLASLRPALEDAGDPSGGSRGTRDLRGDAEDNPDSFIAQLAYGASLLGERNYDEAIRYFERAKELFPGFAEADSPYWHLAMIARERGDLRRAADELTDLTAINEKHYEANVALAEILEELDDPAGAAEALERVIYIYPMEIALHERLAELYARIENHDLHVRERQAVVALVPVDMAEALYQLALAQVGAGDLAAAKRSVLGSLEIAPGYPAAQQLLLDLVGRSSNEEGS